MNIKQAIGLNERFAKESQSIFDKSLSMLVASDIGSKDFNYAWDILRAHVDHYRYNSISEECKPRILGEPQPPLEPCKGVNHPYVSTDKVEATSKFGSNFKVNFDTNGQLQSNEIPFANWPWIEFGSQGRLPEEGIFIMTTGHGQIFWGKRVGACLEFPKEYDFKLHGQPVLFKQKDYWIDGAE